MKIEKGDGDLAPGEVRELHLILHVPGELAPGSEYSGNWELPGMVYPIAIQVGGEVVPEEPPDTSGDPHTPQ
jgi:hypothetical protein